MEYRKERDRINAKLEEEAIARGDFEEVFVDEFRCEICKKTFKKESVLEDHLKSKKHREAEARYKAKYQLDDDVET